jgi:hypothetical protein
MHRRKRQIRLASWMFSLLRSYRHQASHRSNPHQRIPAPRLLLQLER